MSLSRLPPELLELILANIFPDIWNYYSCFYYPGLHTADEWNYYNGELRVLSLRTVCRKYFKRIF